MQMRRLLVLCFNLLGTGLAMALWHKPVNRANNAMQPATSYGAPTPQS
jgi:hypothetical protein